LPFPFPSALSAFMPPLLLCYITVCCLLFRFWGSQFAQGLCWFILGLYGGILHDAVCFAECLTGMFEAGGSSCCSSGSGNPALLVVQ
jgi:hypothetical protein